MSFSLDAYRKINKLKIIGIIPDVDPYKSLYQNLGVPLGVQEVIFEAYTNQGFKVNASTNQKGTSHDMSSDNNIIQKIMSIGSSAFGKVPALDYPKKFLYSGTECLEWSIDCYLPLNDIPDLQVDAQSYIDRTINNPIARLFGLFLPSQSDKTVSTDIVNSISSWANTWVGEIISSASTASNKYIGKVYSLNVPFPYALGANEVDQNLIFRIGGMRIEEVVVTGADVRIPPFTYENGLPDHVDITISFSTLRPLTTNTFKDGMFKLKQ